jgi:Fibronectin type III domain
MPYVTHSGPFSLANYSSKDETLTTQSNRARGSVAYTSDIGLNVYISKSAAAATPYISGSGYWLTQSQLSGIGLYSFSGASSTPTNLAGSWSPSAPATPNGTAFAFEFGVSDGVVVAKITIGATVYTFTSAASQPTFGVYATARVDVATVSNLYFDRFDSPIVTPNPPTGVTISEATGTSAKVNWTAPISGSPADQYTVRYRTVGATTWITAMTLAAPLFLVLSALTSAANYEVQVSSLNSAGQSTFTASQTFTTDNVLTGGGALTSLNAAPTLTNPSTVNVAENATAVIQLTATDPENNPLTFGKNGTGGTDGALFSVSAAGVVSLLSPIDFEAGNNVRTLNVQVSDGTNTSLQTLTVNVTNVLEALSISGLTAGASGSTATVTVRDEANALVSGVTLAWTGSPAGSAGGTTSGTGQASVTLPTATGSSSYTLTATKGAITANQAVTVTSLLTALAVSVSAPAIAGSAATITVKNATTLALIAGAEILVNNVVVGSTSGLGVVSYTPASAGAYAILARYSGLTATAILNAIAASATVPGIVLTPSTKQTEVGLSIDFQCSYRNAQNAAVVGTLLDAIITTNVPYTLDVIAATNATGNTIVRIWPSIGGAGSLQVKKGLDLSNAVAWEAVDTNSSGAQWNRPVLPS